MSKTRVDRRGAKALARCLPALASGLLTLLLLELGVRVYKREFGLRNFREESRGLLRSATPAVFDRELGWIPRPGAGGVHNVWKTQVTIQRDGIRSNGRQRPPRAAGGGDLILAVGDSYTFGDEVSDHETWPACLEALTGVPVLNGGVFAYGVDQAYLRMRQLYERHRPTHIVFSLITDDIQRCDLAERSGLPKPYFDIVNDRLVLRTAHVRPRPEDERKSPFRDALGYSLLAHKIMRRAFPSYWLEGASRREPAHHDGEAVTCRIFRALAEFVREHPGVKGFYLLIQEEAQPEPEDEGIVDRVLACADRRFLQVVDLRPVLDEQRAGDPKAQRRLFRRHMTPEGNRLVAQVLARSMGLEARTGRAAVRPEKGG